MFSLSKWLDATSDSASARSALMLNSNESMSPWTAACFLSMFSAISSSLVASKLFTTTWEMQQTYVNVSKQAQHNATRRETTRAGGRKEGRTGGRQGGAGGARGHR